MKKPTKPQTPYTLDWTPFRLTNGNVCFPNLAHRADSDTGRAWIVCQAHHPAAVEFQKYCETSVHGGKEFVVSCLLQLKWMKAAGRIG